MTAARCLSDVRPERFVPELAAVNAVHRQLIQDGPHRRRDVWKQQQARSAVEPFVDEQRRQPRVQDAVRRRDPFGPRHVSRLVASTPPDFRFEWYELVWPADDDQARTGRQAASVTPQHGDKPVDDVCISRQTALFPAAAEVQHEIRMRQLGEILAEEKLLQHVLQTGHAQYSLIVKLFVFDNK